MAAGHYKLDNLCAIVDWNGLQIDGRNDDVMTVTPIDDKFRAFGFNVIVIDGHDSVSYTHLDVYKRQEWALIHSFRPYPVLRVGPHLRKENNSLFCIYQKLKTPRISGEFFRFGPSGEPLSYNTFIRGPEPSLLLQLFQNLRCLLLLPGCSLSRTFRKLQQHACGC